MPILVCGSLAFDTTIVLNEKLKTQATETDAFGNTNFDLYFVVPDLRREFGGCAGNITYSLNLLGKEALPMGTVGADFGLYAQWLDKTGISRDYIREMEHSYTAQTYIVHDMDDNKITAFHPGAMNFSHFSRIPNDKLIELAVIAPDGDNGMKMHAQQLVQVGIPFLFYPGYSLSQTFGEDILAFIEQAAWMVIHEEDLSYIRSETGLSEQQLANRVRALVINRGEQGAMIHSAGVEYQVPGCTPKTLFDESGCDDAFCAGLLYGLANDIDWETTGRIASLMWSIKAEHHGTQQHRFTLEGFKSLFQKTYGYALIS